MNFYNSVMILWGQESKFFKDRIKNSTHDNDIFVLTKHTILLSKLFYYVKEDIMDERGFHPYGLMALLANDYLE